ncbi:hypothetical protein EJ110_NYTH37252 [Nymphaea thermarum]|nr:hypothetical protein EJ110_NYTH37252 [Nymphaea thermarum]
MDGRRQTMDVRRWVSDEGRRTAAGEERQTTTDRRMEVDDVNEQRRRRMMTSATETPKLHGSDTITSSRSLSSSLVSRDYFPSCCTWFFPNPTASVVVQIRTRDRSEASADDAISSFCERMMLIFASGERANVDMRKRKRERSGRQPSLSAGPLPSDFGHSHQSYLVRNHPGRSFHRTYPTVERWIYPGQTALP